MSEFRVGDVVEVLESSRSLKPGTVFTVTEVTIAMNPWGDKLPNYYVSGDINGWGVWPQFLRLVEPGDATPDAVDHPKHYTAYKGIEIIELTEQMNFNRGNVVKYVARAGIKDEATEVEDLRKAAWYLNREIERLGAAA